MRGQGHVFSKVSLKMFPLEVSAYITEKLKKNEICDTELQLNGFIKMTHIVLIIL